MRQARAGKLRLLAVASARRTPLAPDAPTMAEAGTDIDASTVHGLYVPGGTPRDIVVRLAREMDRAMRSPEGLKAMGPGIHLQSSRAACAAR